MENIINYQVLWFILVLVLFMGYSLLDGFDLGAAALMPFLAKTKEEKDILVGSIGPVWDGNEVWLVTGGGALFAAFPQAYATAFSGFYLAMMLVLFSLIFRAISMEFRAHDEKRAGFWEAMLAGGSGLAALLFGVALGNVVYGVPLDLKMEYAGNFFTLLRPVPILFGLTGLAAVLMQGSTYAIMKTEGEIQQRAFRAAEIILGFYGALVAVFAALMIALTKGKFIGPLFTAGLLAAMLGLAGMIFSLKKKNEKAPFWESGFTFIGIWLMVAAVHFPNMIKASNGAELSLTIFNASTGIKTLKIMSLIALIGMPVVIGYTIFVYRIFKGKARRIYY